MIDEVVVHGQGGDGGGGTWSRGDGGGGQEGDGGDGGGVLWVAIFSSALTGW